ncbi:NEW3 domain-containing protein [Thermococcus sp. 21S7]|uniref:COG1470 family protein n=1 Tax=Thermococcus sp. 21S7 TaxID=1638221 RepID=UPI00143CB12D|nr:NEW3 domain-containing protein [Thermococcus sp. 21S7]NJE62517.1 PEGA domain-containing protein [Thermococcus sp. 21S7]
MRKLTGLAFLFLLLTIPLEAATTIGITLHTGQSVVVNGITVEFTDFSGSGQVAFKINGTTRILSFGETVKIASGINMTVGSLKTSEGAVHVVFWGTNLNIKRSPSSVQLETQFPSKVTEPGKKVVFTVTVRNTGDDAFIPLSAEAPFGWNVKIMGGDSEINGVYLKHGESATISVVVTAGQRTGKFPIVLKAGESELSLTVIVRSGGVSISCPYPIKETEAGEDVHFTLHLTSPGAKVLELKAEVPEGWSARFIANGEPIKAVTVEGEAQVTLVISVPSNAPVGDYKVRVRAGDSEETLGVHVSKTHAGENGTLTVKVLDEEGGSYIAGALVELVGPEGVLTEAKSLSDGTASLEAPEGEYTLRVSKKAYKTVEKTIRLKAGRESEVKVNMRRLPYYFDLETPEPSKSEPLGQTFTYAVVIRNLGSEDDSYSLSLTTPENWGGMIVEDQNSRTGVGSVYVKAGEEKTLYVILIPPDNAKLGNYTATLTVKSSGSGEEKRAGLTATLTGSYGIGISLEKYSLRADAGGRAETNVRVYSTGTSPLTNVKLEVKAPKGWSVRVEPKKVPTLKGNDEVEFTVEVLIPENVDAGDYVLNIKAVSDQRSKETSVRVTVKKGSGQTYIGIGIIVGAILILGMVLWRYGRR